MTMLRDLKLLLGIASVALLAGCSVTLRAQPVTSTERGDRIDHALSAATKFLVAAQSSDRAWRSDVYAAFKEGDALTPLVLEALMEMPQTKQNRDAIAKGSRYLADMIREDGSIVEPPNGLTYPVYTASGAVIVLSRQN